MSNAFLDMIDKNWKKLEKKDQESKKKGKLVGRFITEPYADGSAVYKIVSESGDKVRIKVVRNIGDDWEIPYWGEETTIKKSYVLEKLHQKDAMNKFLKQQSKKKLKRLM